MPKLNGVSVSQKILAHLSGILPEATLRNEYGTYSDIEISKKYGLSERWVCKLRKIYGITTNPQYKLRRNPLRHTELSSYQKKVLHGSLFGDSSIAAPGYWICTHSTKQNEYLIKKANILKPFLAKISYGTRPFEKGGKEFPYICGRTHALPQFMEYRKKFYPEGIKIITLDLLKEMTPVGMAYWWMDDGLAGKYSFNIVTYEDVFRQLMEKTTKTFKETLDLNVSITWDGKEGNICILRDSHETMWSYIKNEITSDMIYKLPQKYK